MKREDCMRLFSYEELTQRVGRFQIRLAEQKVGAALLTANSDLFYFTGSVQRGLLVVPAEGTAVYFVRKHLDRARRESPLTVEPFETEQVRGFLVPYSTIGFAADVTTVAERDFLAAKVLPARATLTDISLPLALTKMIKSPAEIAFIEQAAAINRAVHCYAREAFRPGMRDLDLQVAIESYARRELGHPGSFRLRGPQMEGAISLVVTGESALEATYTDFPIGGRGLSPAVAQGASGEVIERYFVVDFIGAHHGYSADSTRTYFIGKPPENIACIYGELCSFLDKVVSFVTPGITGEEAWNYATSLVGACSWQDGFMGLDAKVKFLGHGIGGEVNQLPVIAAKQKTSFENGMTIAIEPKVFVPGWGIIGVENTYVMEKGRLRSLTGEMEPIEEMTLTK